jgi:polyribonucleotide 5'-hydroxyl-kinase
VQVASLPLTLGGTSASAAAMTLPGPPRGFERYTLKAHEELRIEVPFYSSSRPPCVIRLVSGSAELFGQELAKELVLSSGGIKLALFTWHGCVIDVNYGNDESDQSISPADLGYISNDTAANIALVNTHAQLEVLRDEAVLAISTTGAAASEGPRVLVVGPQESGVTSFVKVLLAYAVKVGRGPIVVDLDVAENIATGIPGTISATTLASLDALSATAYGTGGLLQAAPSSSSTGTSSSSQQQHRHSSSVVLWYGSTSPTDMTELYQAQIAALGVKIDARMRRATEPNQDDPTSTTLSVADWIRTSGLLVNTSAAWATDPAAIRQCVAALRINVILVVGQDRLYSQLKSLSSAVKVIKLPRSGGVVSRDAAFRRQTRSRNVKRYFYGDWIDAPAAAASAKSTTAPATMLGDSGPSLRVPQLTPFAMSVSFKELTIYKYQSMSLASSLLPVGHQQTTAAIQLVPMILDGDSSSLQQLQHQVLAVCHPTAVQAYAASQETAPELLYTSGVAGLVVVERVDVDSEKIHLLSPCAGSLPSQTLLAGQVTWLE